MNHHIVDRAGFIASLSKNDPERHDADAHGAGCAACRDALDEGGRLMSLLREAVPLAGSTPDGLARATELVERETDAERRTERRFRLAVAGAVAVAWVFQLMVGSGFTMHPRQLAGSLAVLAVAIGSVSLLGQRERWALPLIVATSGLFALAAGAPGPLEAGIGIRCSFRELWSAGVTCVLVLAAARRLQAQLDRWNLAAVVAAGALAAHAGQHLACEVPHSDAHVLVFHVSAVVLVAAVGTATSLVSAPARPAVAGHQHGDVVV